MAGDLVGDFARLRRLTSELSTIDRGAMAAATNAAKEGATEAYKGDFAAQRDPWGEAWEPTKLGKTPVLNSSGLLASSQATGSGGVIRIKPVRYWVFHQVGANGMRRRAILPFSPSRWDTPIQAFIERAVIQRLELLG